jgi:hypothetical protein
MNAANITHGLRLAGGNTRMWVGVLVIAIVFAITAQWLANEEHRLHIERGLFG